LQRSEPNSDASSSLIRAVAAGVHRPSRPQNMRQPPTRQVPKSLSSSLKPDRLAPRPRHQATLAAVYARNLTAADNMALCYPSDHIR
jgi:hypothetical protein